MEGSEPGHGSGGHAITRFMRRFWLIAVGTVAVAALIAVGVWAAVIWFRPPGPEFTTKQWAFITAHVSDPRVHTCFGRGGHLVTFVPPAYTAKGYVPLAWKIASETGVSHAESPAAFLACVKTRLRAR